MRITSRLVLGGGDIGEATTERHRDETVKAFQAADRLRLYGLLSMLGGVVLFVAVVGAVIIGWIDWVDGVVWAALALLVAVAPGARWFYADATRTTVNAASVERSLGLDEDLFAPTLATASGSGSAARSEWSSH